MEFMSTFYRECKEYAQAYQLGEDYIWFCMGAIWYTQGASTAEIPDLLDNFRIEHSTVKERMT